MAFSGPCYPKIIFEMALRNIFVKLSASSAVGREQVEMKTFKHFLIRILYSKKFHDSFYN